MSIRARLEWLLDRYGVLVREGWFTSAGDVFWCDGVITDESAPVPPSRLVVVGAFFA